MTPQIYALIAFLVLIAAYLAFRMSLRGRTLRSYFGKMLVACPETHETVAVKVAAGRATAAALVGKEHVELSQCTRWPERSGCDQACLSEIKADPRAHQVWTIASKWYAGKTCYFCHRPIAELSHLDHSPGLVDADGKIVEWDEIPAEKLLPTLESGSPVCWNCSVVEAFWKEHPQLVIQRPWKH